MKAPKEWLTYRICKSYRERANKYENITVKEKFKLTHELMERCGVTELEAINILSGVGVQDYVRKYEILKEKYMDILINGEKMNIPKRLRRKPRPLPDPNQIKLISSQKKASGQ